MSLWATRRCLKAAVKRSSHEKHLTHFRNIVATAALSIELNTRRKVFSAGWPSAESRLGCRVGRQSGEAGLGRSLNAGRPAINEEIANLEELHLARGAPVGDRRVARNRTTSLWAICFNELARQLWRNGGAGAGGPCCRPCHLRSRFAATL